MSEAFQVLASCFFAAFYSNRMFVISVDYLIIGCLRHYKYFLCFLVRMVFIVDGSKLSV